MPTIFATDHARAEWHRIAVDAYKTGRNKAGHMFSVASAVYTGEMPIETYDNLQRIYRRWLNWGWEGVENPKFWSK